MRTISINYAEAWLMGVDPTATGRQLKKLRRAHHLTQEYLSELFEQGGDSASRNIISMWEGGKKLPTLSHMVFLAELYGCALDELVISYRRSREDDDRGQPVLLLFSISTKLTSICICGCSFFVNHRSIDQRLFSIILYMVILRVL